MKDSREMNVTMTLHSIRILMKIFKNSMKNNKSLQIGISPIFQDLIATNISGILDGCLDSPSTPNYFVTYQAKLSQVMPVEDFSNFVKELRWEQQLLKVMERASRTIEEMWDSTVFPFLNQRDIRMLDISNLVVQRNNFLVSEKHRCNQASLLFLEQTRDQEKERMVLVKYHMLHKDLVLEKKWKSVFQNLSSHHPVWSREPLKLPIRDVAQKDSELLFWKLDKMEFGSRMRCKLRRNFRGSKHEDASHQHWSQKWKQEKEEAERKRSELMSTQQGIEQAKNPGLDLITVEPTVIEPEPQNGNLTHSLPPSPKHVATTSKTNTIYSSTDCHLVLPEITIPGKLEVTNKKIMFYYDREWLADIKATKSEGEAEYSQSGFIQMTVKRFESKFKDRCWKLDDLQFVYSRRYLLIWTAIEIFLTNGRNYFFNLPMGQNKKIFSVIVGQKPRNLEFSFFGHSQTLFSAHKGITEKWQRREISNFDYLMELNTIAGRTYNDMTQYPVFPWILSNYTSSTLDINDEANYRDLSKPVGGLNPERLQKFQERYESFTDSIPFHYGSHYSSAAGTLFYLLRMEPFTTQFICLQSGRFDYPNRLFHGIQAVWKNCMESGTDVKELIPEFFYMPDFLKNSNGFDLGTTSSGLVIGDVELPPWAKTAEEFIAINRLALESEYVSQNLHHWIDLIFGYKQRGPESVKACNTFYFLTYEGAVDYTTLDDPVRAEAVRTQIENFGQTPPQLLTTPHPQRNPPAFTIPISLEPNADLFSGIQGLVQQLPYNGAYHVYPMLSGNKLVTINGYGEYLIHTFKFNEESGTSKSIPFRFDIDNNYSSSSSLSYLAQEMRFYGKTRLLLSLKNITAGNRRLNVKFNLHEDSISGLPILVEDGSEIKAIIYKTWNNALQVSVLEGFETGSAMLPCTQSVDYPRQGAITCAQISGPWLACGTETGLVSVWRCTSQSGFDIVGSLRKLTRSVTSVIQGTEKLGENWVLPSDPNFVIDSHLSQIKCLAVNQIFDLLISVCARGTIAVHHLKDGKSTTTINHDGDATLSHLLISETSGNFVVYSKEKAEIYLYTITGILLGKSESNEDVSSMVLTKDGRFLLCASQNSIAVKTLPNLQTIYKLKETPTKITGLQWDPTERVLFAFLEDGKLVIYWNTKNKLFYL
eukprot:TRINITY_DN1671_c0_g1_i4.p1 TRINITY_DN1671_c0_g1~~TRINITY_DN1671_c0_g1_i4.p1  ORF type:complete len:1157 (+),score=202.86 TRINITY_DN1671_c0_g1_i4:3973-7443(+)